MIFWGIDSETKRKEKVEAGKKGTIPRPVPGEAPDTPPIPTSHVEGENEKIFSSNSTERFIVISYPIFA